MWVRVAVVSYYYSVSLPLRESPLMGVSLYVPTWSERVDQPFWMDPTFPVYGMQAPSSWGAVYFPYQWTSFRRWQKAHATADPLVPGLASINGWSMDKSWKKYLIRYMVEQGYYMLYPNRIDGLSFSTNHAEAGTNVYFSSEWKKVLDARFNVPLVTAQRQRSMVPAAQCGAVWSYARGGHLRPAGQADCAAANNSGAGPKRGEATAVSPLPSPSIHRRPPRRMLSWPHFAIGRTCSFCSSW